VTEHKPKHGAAHATGRASLVDALGPSSAPPRGYSGGSVRSKATQILSDAPGAVSSHMRRSFVDRQYSPPTGMDQSVLCRIALACFV
jgi:hypothetical protein